MTPIDVSELTRLLAPYREAGFGTDDADGWRFTDAPPPIARAALELVDPTVANARPNGQPPNGWLVDQAAELDGRVCGLVAPARRFLRIDTLGVSGPHARTVAARVQAIGPPGPDDPGSLYLSVVEAWNNWTSTRAFWTGRGGDELPDLAPTDVTTYWWA